MRIPCIDYQMVQDVVRGFSRRSGFHTSVQQTPFGSEFPFDVVVMRIGVLPLQIRAEQLDLLEIDQ